MTQSLSVESRPPGAAARGALQGAAGFWFVTAVLGQWLFAAYVAIFYGGAAARGDLGAWAKVLPHGMIAGDTAGNIALAAHLVLAFIITVGGPLQLTPQLRARAPTFHRWTGRLYIFTAFAASLGGLYMVWTRGTVGGLAQHIAISINAVLIMGFAAITVRQAMARRIDSHRRWALRLFMVVSGVWFFRVGLMLWLLIHRAPVGIGENFDGPFVVTLAFAQYVVPLGVLELYLRTQDRGGDAARFAMASFLILLSVAMAGGIFGAAMMMWLPRL